MIYWVAYPYVGFAAAGRRVRLFNVSSFIPNENQQLEKNLIIFSEHIQIFNKIIWKGSNPIAHQRIFLTFWNIV